MGDPTPLVYRRLFAAFPHIEPLFARDTTGAIRGEMLAVAFECLLDIDGIYAANLIRTERVNHQGFGVDPAAFASFFPVVMETCRDVLGADWTPEMDAAWRDILRRLEGLTGAVRETSRA